MNDVMIMARTLWGEARGGGDQGMEAVANVIMNRARNPRWWGETPETVCLMPYQFSCWLANDPNRAKLLAVTPEDPDFAAATAIAHRAVLGLLLDLTENADSYYAINSPAPDWVRTARHTVTIGGQAFYRIELPGPKPLVTAPIPIPV